MSEEFLILGVKQYHFGYVTLTTHFVFHEHLNEQDSTDIQKMDISGKPRQQQTTDDCIQIPNTSQRITGRPTSHKGKTIETLTGRAQLDFDTRDN